MRRFLHFLPVGRSLALIVAIFVAIVTGLLLLNNVRSQILSAVRAYVGGESLYSKGQKDAVNHLVRYARSHHEADYRKFRRALDIPLGDHHARLELEQPSPDPARVRAGFLAGLNHPEDVDNMAMLFRRFRRVSYMAHAIDIWTAGDALIVKLGELGDELHTGITSGGLDPQRTDPLLDEVDAVNLRLTALEDDFSRTLGEGNRWLEHRLLQIMYAAAVLLLITGVWVSWMILRQVAEVDRERREAQAHAGAQARQHEAIARLGETALSGRDLQSLMDQAAATVAQTLRTELCAVLELLPENGGLALRAGVGWRPGYIGRATVDVQPHSHASYTLASATPVILHDLRTETRFVPSALLRDHGVVSGISAIIAAHGGRHFGVVETYTTAARSFTRDDVNFLAAVANMLAVAMERKRAEEALQEANRQKDHFLAMLAHELRNPLSPIRNAVHVIREVDAPEPRLDWAREIIDRQVTHMSRLLDDLLDVARIARGKIVLRQDVVDLGHLVRLAGEDYRATLESRGVALHLALPEQPVWVQGDPTRLSQTAGNLLHNASKFTNPGDQVTVTLETDGERAAAVLSVHDTGIGIEPEALEHIFETFGQADRSLDRSRGGLGLGLAVVKGLVELHGGAVQAISAGPGKGSTFTVRLPLMPAPAPTRPSAATIHTGPASCRVLVIEDNLDVAESMKYLLEFDGHQVAVAHTGSSGIEIARRFRPEVVLCDIGLPGGMDGFGVAKVMRNDAALDPVALIALTGYGQEEDRRRTREAGFDMHLIKPVDPVLLRELLARVSDRASQ